MKKLTVILTAVLLCAFTAGTAYAASDDDAMYGIGSVSKVFGAAAVMKLVDEGLVGLDEPLVTYIPEFRMADERYVRITPRMLLNHSSGLMGSTFKDSWLLGDTNPRVLDHFLEALARQRLKHNPGERSIYCNDGFTLAEILVERVSGMSFTEFIERKFSAPLGIENIKTAYSDFDRRQLGDIYVGNNALQPENLLHIASGGIYSSMEDLCRYAEIFMDSADGAVLSKRSVNEMSENQHKMEMLPPGAATFFRYGLGWDAVDLYPFSRLGIQALSKGGNSMRYNTNLTILPEYNIAAAVSSSGSDGHAAIIAREIILAVLMEEGLLDPGAVPAMPELNLEQALIPDHVKSNAGIYGGGFMVGTYQAGFTDYTLVLTPVASVRERPQEFLYNTDGVFVSTNGDYLGKWSGDNLYGISTLTFEGNYLVSQTYEDVPGLGHGVMSMPVAEKLEANPVSDRALAAWAARDGKEYLLSGERHSSVRYLSAPIAKTLTDSRASGYVFMGIYRGSAGAWIAEAKIADENRADAFQITPTMNGRDGADLSVSVRNDVEYLDLKQGDAVYMDATAAMKFSELGDCVTISGGAVWVDVDDEFTGKVVYIDAPQNSSWFVYDERMNCIATSLEKNPRDRVILPENGRLAFVGVLGAEFVLRLTGT